MDIPPGSGVSHDRLGVPPYLGTMQRPLLSRIVAVLLSFWFVAVSAGPELTHACPTHGSHTATASAHSAHGATPTPEKSNQCTCLGQCCSSTPVAIASSDITLVEVLTAASRDAGLPDYEYVPVAAQHVLPPPNGPPLSA